jgi:hypothetical protein
MFQNPFTYGLPKKWTMQLRETIFSAWPIRRISFGHLGIGCNIVAKNDFRRKNCLRGPHSWV